MANIANNTYLFYGDKDELVKCHEMINDIMRVIGSNKSWVKPDVLRINPEWVNYIDDINPGVDDRFYMGTESKWYGNPVYWHDWVKSNFTNLAVAFRCEEPMMGIFDQIDPDNMLPDVVWVSGNGISEDDLSKLPPAVRDCVGEYVDNTYYVANTFHRDELFNSNFEPSDLPDSIGVQEYNNLTYEELIKEDEQLSGLRDTLVAMHSF